MTTIDEEGYEWLRDANKDTERTYGIAGLFVYSPSKKWFDAGVCSGDFLGSTSCTGDVNSTEKIHKALAAPEGTELMLMRDGKRIVVTL